MEELIGGIGAALIFVAQVWVAVVAFRKSILWGLAVLCLTPVAWVFIILNWSSTKGAVVLYVVGMLMAGWGGQRVYERQMIEQSRSNTSEA
jgi:hypothetical protein